MVLDLSYEALRHMVEPHKPKARTESRAFLAWFLENIYRLDPVDAQDCVCDGPDDKGVDGVYVDHDSHVIDIFQSRLSQRDERTIGDTSIKKIVGTLAQFERPEQVQDIIDTTGNVELRNLLVEQRVKELVNDGFAIRGILVTNIDPDDSAIQYLKRIPDVILVKGRSDIIASYVSPDRVAPQAGPTDFEVFGLDIAKYTIGDATMVVAPLRADQLVTLNGLASGELFDYNVRQSLGKTKVNKDIATSLARPDEHQNFLLYHNGITIVADSVDISKPDTIRLTDYVVVNGCQSLTVLYDNRHKITGDLRLLCRLIELTHNPKLMDAITHHTNNQNGIKARDFQSNNPIQLRLRNEFATQFGGDIFYRISRGETPGNPDTAIIDNQDAARALLAFDLRQPWTCHQTYKLFDELHGDIFARPHVNASRIVSRMDVFHACAEAVSNLQNDLMAHYTLTKYFLMDMVAGALESDDHGKEFLEDPTPFVATPDLREKLRTALHTVLDALLVDLNFQVASQEADGAYFDFKRVLKSPVAARELSNKALTVYGMAAKTNRIASFSDTWDSPDG